MTHPHFERLDALLRAVAFPVYDVADDQSCGQPRSVTLVQHGTDVSVRIRHIGEPAGYRECWRHVDSRDVQMEPPLWRARGPYRALREAVRWRYLAPRLLGGSVIAEPRARRRPAHDDVVIEEVDVLVDGESQRGLMAQDGSAFGCYLLLAKTKVSISGCHPPGRLSLVRADKQDLLRMPRAWGAPDAS
jgi:hypothetical protein